ncbi:hypothetical protein DY000_02013332 [Brassica cretica]|uniref:Uncharacterized protein n=1 Tax=Brassica cretica TaxID=69181 RepID=A0ABQ7CUD3_BRACR|nr:hypothetical protein DY000_02013332 [Brassica cretica]
MRYITIIRGNSSVTGYKGKGIIIDDDKPIQLTDQADDNLIREYGLSLIDKFLNPEKNKMLRNLSDLCNVGIRSLQMMFSAVHNDLDSPLSNIDHLNHSKLISNAVQIELTALAQTKVTSSSYLKEGEKMCTSPQMLWPMKLTKSVPTARAPAGNQKTENLCRGPPRTHVNYSSSAGGDYTNSKRHGKYIYSSKKLKSNSNLKRNV